MEQITEEGKISSQNGESGNGKAPNVTDASNLTTGTQPIRTRPRRELSQLVFSPRNNDKKEKESVSSQDNAQVSTNTSSTTSVSGNALEKKTEPVPPPP